MEDQEQGDYKTRISHKLLDLSDDSENFSYCKYSEMLTVVTILECCLGMLVIVLEWDTVRRRVS